jgi:hypothetical protein
MKLRQINAQNSDRGISVFEKRVGGCAIPLPNNTSPECSLITPFHRLAYGAKRSTAADVQCFAPSVQAHCQRGLYRFFQKLCWLSGHVCLGDSPQLVVRSMSNYRPPRSPRQFLKWSEVCRKYLQESLVLTAGNSSLPGGKSLSAAPLCSQSKSPASAR